MTAVSCSRAGGQEESWCGEGVEEDEGEGVKETESEDWTFSPL